MLAIAILFAQGVFEHYLGMEIYGMGQEMFDAVLAGEVEDVRGLRWMYQGMVVSGYAGLGLLWIAALLTLWTGWEYFRKALPHLKD
jgi:CDP-diacylglycerol--glycerol-3-phosphate 3-phosphatidyltransferase